MKKKYTSHFICVRESWRRKQKLQHIDPHSYGHNGISFSFLLGCSTGGLGGPASLGAGFLNRILSPVHLISTWLTSCLHPGYIIIWHPLFCLRASQFRTFNPSTVKFYIHRPDAPVIYTGAFSYFDSPAGSEVIIQHYQILPLWTWVGSGRDSNEVVLSIPQSPQHYWSLTFKLFSVIFRTLVGGSNLSTEIQSVYSTAPGDGATKILCSYLRFFIQLFCCFFIRFFYLAFFFFFFFVFLHMVQSDINNFCSFLYLAFFFFFLSFCTWSNRI